LGFGEILSEDLSGSGVGKGWIKILWIDDDLLFGIILHEETEFFLLWMRHGKGDHTSASILECSYLAEQTLFLCGFRGQIPWFLL
jgi:hypothetical protein